MRLTGTLPPPPPSPAQASTLTPVSPHATAGKACIDSRGPVSRGGELCRGTLARPRCECPEGGRIAVLQLQIRVAAQVDVLQGGHGGQLARQAREPVVGGARGRQGCEPHGHRGREVLQESSPSAPAASWRSGRGCGHAFSPMQDELSMLLNHSCRYMQGQSEFCFQSLAGCQTWSKRQVT